MIVKIMKAIPTFAGINYNEKKNRLGQSELLSAANFPFLEMRKLEYISYMEAVCATNKNVKNKQFHAVISCKGRENNAEQLNEIAKVFIKEMGYGENPYLIYFHSDTANNHVHIVSTRVNKKGAKINDSNERVKAQEVMARIMGADLGQNALEQMSNALTFNFSTKAQFFLLLERVGYQVFEKCGEIKIKKAGQVLYSTPIELLEEKMRGYLPNSKRNRQITALFHKYAGIGAGELQNLMKVKFGIDVVYHFGKGHITPYGFTVIDNVTKNVMKGGEIFDIKNIISPVDSNKIDSCKNIVNELLTNDKISSNDFKKQLSLAGFSYQNSGNIVENKSGRVLYKIDESKIKELNYWSRVGEAQFFCPQNERDAAVLSKIFFVKEKDIVLSQMSKENTYYQEILGSYLSNNLETSELEKRGILIVKSGNETYILDKNEGYISSATNLGLSINSENLGDIYTPNIDFINEKSNEFETVESVLSVIESVVLQGNAGGESSSRRKRKRNINQ